MPTQVLFKNIKETIISEISKSEKTLDVAVAWLTEPYIVTKISNLLERNINVRIISFDDKINKTGFFEKLYYKGADVRLSKKLMHNKFCIIDNKTIISGSFNWTKGASTNDENITIIRDDYNVTTDFKNEFEKLWSRCKNIDSKLKINNDFLHEIYTEFNTYLLNVNSYYNFPILYYVPEDFKNGDFRNNDYGKLYKGFYLIRNTTEFKKSFKYILYAMKGINLKELKYKADINLELVSEHFLEIIPSIEENEVTEIQTSVWGIKKGKNPSRYTGDKDTVVEIDSNGSMSQEFEIVAEFNEAYIIFDDGYKILDKKKGILLFDFQKSQRDGFEKYNQH